MKIIVDAMGGDNAPFEIVAGAAKAVKELNVDVVLTGKVEEILKCFEKLGMSDLPRGIEIANATQTIEMDEDPVTAVRTKKDSSMVVGLRMLRDGSGDAMVSAGSTGALLSGATLIVKRIRGVRRAALAPCIPCTTGEFMIIDCGANTECTAEYLLQFAFMGYCYMESVKENPRVGLLNIGTEETKGTKLQHDAYKLLKKANDDNIINFIGNVEAKELMMGACDVIVCDGFSGNILLKALEGASKFFVTEIKDIFKRNAKSKISALLVKDGVMELKEKMNADRIGGTSLMGISKPVIKAHGSSKADAVFGAIRQAMATVDTKVVDKIASNIDRMKVEEDVE